MNYKKPIAVLACIIALCTSSCIRSPHIYRLDIDQGNKLSNELVCQLKVGMTADEVRDLLGTPVLDSIFRKDRWYYM
jgi:outer membrane protein assembly factor BamE